MMGTQCNSSVTLGLVRTPRRGVTEISPALVTIAS
jgi:hypothetical protein